MGGAHATGGGIRLEKNTSLLKWVMVRGRDDFLPGIVADGVGMGFFAAGGALRFARHGRAPNHAGEQVGPDVTSETVCRVRGAGTKKEPAGAAAGWGRSSESSAQSL